MKKQLGFTAFELTIAIVAVIGSIGWLWNIVKLAGMDFATISGMMVLRAIGIFVAPLGAVLGYL